MGEARDWSVWLAERLENPWTADRASQSLSQEALTQVFPAYFLGDSTGLGLEIMELEQMLMLDELPAGVGKVVRDGEFCQVAGAALNRRRSQEGSNFPRHRRGLPRR
eukprot:3451122-Rhodomonas_salina.1